MDDFEGNPPYFWFNTHETWSEMAELSNKDSNNTWPRFVALVLLISRTMDFWSWKFCFFLGSLPGGMIIIFKGETSS